jgi:hypothetical protein
LLEVEDDAGAGLAAGADEELSELDLDPLSLDEAEDESLPPSLLLEVPSFVDAPSFDPPSAVFGAAEDLEG